MQNVSELKQDSASLQGQARQDPDQVQPKRYAFRVSFRASCDGSDWASVHEQGLGVVEEIPGQPGSVDWR